MTNALRHKGIQNRKERLEKSVELLESVGLDASDLDRFPHQFSGGQQQRIAIARALAFDPILLILDEPTASLDVSVQTQITRLLRNLQDRFGHSYVLISHDLSTVRHVAQRVAVMYLGKLVEVGSSEIIFADPQHPYTQILIQSVPIPVPALRRDHIALEGEIPSSTSPPSGCRFHTRCPKREEICARAEPRLESTSVRTEVACHLAHKRESKS
jgi:oligopeptide/dipeptide ABC transporter ATP-binding protein